mmetsp:Transcript_2076/g.3671  ORF Transcript_2076/g.3671 Transcript_2076/m.3671 type:complete len:200 (-) Transcript_2076:50-649(-)|eukprot:CAMPEP_0182441608 /NCGR_PEP_ID=MMETSP1172-20130603/583_1 /TAXON_ID=708627 /ORGANISM="Timspurckia oligopyrenoides, Strain CCMP3278" /LENGTH=199 /DNA_ID=CAMNT_0024635995 /DNA_START=37 /DNA_END=636 /DNA_ORIENTATION=-
MRGLSGHFSRLGLTSSASEQELHAAFKKLAKKFHPDVHSGSAKIHAESVFKEIAASYQHICEARKFRNARGNSYAGEESNSYGFSSNYDYRYGWDRPRAGSMYSQDAKDLMYIFGVPILFGILLAVHGAYIAFTADYESPTVTAGSVTRFKPDHEYEKTVMAPAILTLKGSGSKSFSEYQSELNADSNNENTDKSYSVQ